MKSAIIPTVGNVTYVMSAESGKRDDLQNAIEHRRLLRILGEAIGDGTLDSLLAIRGQYKGTPEQSLAFTGRDNDSLLRFVEYLAKSFGQESVLQVDHRGIGWLIYTNEEVETIGEYQAIDSTHGHDAWSQVVATDETFTFA